MKRHRSRVGIRREKHKTTMRPPTPETRQPRDGDDCTGYENRKAEVKEKVMPTAPCCVCMRSEDRHCIEPINTVMNLRKHQDETDMKQIGSL
jgi:hypothetical protein